MDLSRQITFNTLVQIIGRGGMIFLSLLTTAILTRNLGRVGYGAFGVINTTVVVFFSFADWGTNLITVRELAKFPKKAPSILGNSFLLRSLMAALGVMGFLLFTSLNPAFTLFKKEASVSSLLILFLSLKTSAQIVFHSKLKLHLTALVELIATGLFLFFLLVSKSGFSLWQIVWFLVAASALTAFLAQFLVFKMVRVNFQLDFNLLKRLMRESLPMGASMAIFSVYNRIDTFILQFFKGEAATGIYLLAYKVHDNLVLGAAYLMNAFFPLIANFTTQTLPKVDLKKLLQKAFDLLLAMAIPMVVLIFISSPIIIKFLGGREFLASFGVLRILIFATGVAYLNHLTGYSLVALGRQRVHLKFCALTLVLNIILNFVFIPRYSFIGAALVTVLTETLIFVLTFFYLKKMMRIKLNFTSFPKTFWELITKKGKVF